MECVLFLLHFKPILIVECCSPQETLRINGLIEEAVIQYRADSSYEGNIDEDIVEPEFSSLTLSKKEQFFQSFSPPSDQFVIDRGPSIVGITTLGHLDHRAILFNNFEYHFYPDRLIVQKPGGSDPYIYPLHPTVQTYLSDVFIDYIHEFDLRFYPVDESIDFLKCLNAMVKTNYNYKRLGIFLIDEYLMPLAEAKNESQISKAIEYIRPKANTYGDLLENMLHSERNSATVVYDGIIEGLKFGLNQLEQDNNQS